MDMDKPPGGNKFTNHPCHRLSVPSAKRFWCRHCFDLFEDPISRWRHSKNCKDTQLSNLKKKMKRRPDDENESNPVVDTNFGASNSAPEHEKADQGNVDLCCVICNQEFATVEEIKYHVRFPCNRPNMRAINIRRPKVTYHRDTGKNLIEEQVTDIAQPSSPLDPSNLSSDTRAAVEALNMMARSDKVNLSQFLNQLSEGGFVIEQAAGCPKEGGNPEEREIVFTVQGDESNSILQHAGDITVEVAQDLIRMAQRVRIEAVEHVEEQEVQEEIVQDFETQTEVHYIQNASDFQGQYIPEQTQYVDQTLHVETVGDHVVSAEGIINEDGNVESHVVAEEGGIVCIKPEGGDQDTTFTVLNIATGKKYMGNVLEQGAEVKQVPDNMQVFMVSATEGVVSTKQEPEEASIPGIKRKVEADGEICYEVKRSCTTLTDDNVANVIVKEESSIEAKKKRQFFNECLIMQENCNKNFENSVKITLETVLNTLCENVEKRTDFDQSSNEEKMYHSATIEKGEIFLDEADGEFKPMTKEMQIYQDSIANIIPIMNFENNISKSVPNNKEEDSVSKPFQQMPKKLRSSSRKLILTEKKLCLLEEKEKLNNKKHICKSNLTIAQNKNSLTTMLHSKPVCESVTKPKPIRKPTVRSLKCRACDKVFNTEKQLIKHKEFPCVIKTTRNTCQNILRPNRALPKIARRPIKKKPVIKEKKKLKLLPVALHIHTRWNPINGRSKGRCRFINYAPCCTNRKTIPLPDRTLDVGRLSFKEQYFYEVGLVSLNHLVTESSVRQTMSFMESKFISKCDYGTSPVNNETDLTNCLFVSIDDDNMLSDRDISPPRLTMVSPISLNSASDMEQLQPPVLQSVYSNYVDETQIIDMSENDSPSTWIKCSSLNISSPKNDITVDNGQLNTLGSPSYNDTLQTCLTPNLQNKGTSPHSHPSFQNVCSNVLNSVTPPKKNIPFSTSPRLRKNLFDTLQTLCSSPNSCINPRVRRSKPNLDLKLPQSTNILDSSRNRALCTSPRTRLIKKMPNILVRRSSQEICIQDSVDSANQKCPIYFAPPCVLPT